MAEGARNARSRPVRAGKAHPGTRLLVIEARYYEEIGAALAEGAIAELDANAVAYDVISVPGALEIPQALAQAVRAGASCGHPGSCRATRRSQRAHRRNATNALAIKATKIASPGKPSSTPT